MGGGQRHRFGHYWGSDVNAPQLLEAFDRAKDRMALVWSHAEAIAIVQELQDQTREFVSQRIARRGQPGLGPVVVGAKTRWGGKAR